MKAATITVVVQTDERIEVLMLARNLAEFEDLRYTGEKQIHPLRKAAREEFKTLVNHRLVDFYRMLIEKKDGPYYVSDHRLALLTTAWPEMMLLDDSEAIADSLYDSPSGGYAVKYSRDEVRKDVRDWRELYVEFWRESGFHEFYVRHQEDYREIADTLRETVLKSKLVSWMSRAGPSACESPYVMIPSPLPRPGCNWSAAFTRVATPNVWLRYAVSSPYKKVPLAVFTPGGWNDAPIGFDDGHQLLTVGFHEFLHSVMRPLMNTPEVVSLIDGCRPDEKLFKDVLGSEYEGLDWPSVFEECLIRAYVNVFVHDDVSPFRAELDLRTQRSQGIHLVPLMYQILGNERKASGDVLQLDAETVGKVASAIRDLQTPPVEHNRWNTGLGQFLQSLVPKLIGQQENAKIVITPETLSSSKRQAILQLIHERMFSERDDAFLNSLVMPSPRDLSAHDLFVFSYDEGGTSALSGKILESLRVKLEGDNVVVPSAGSFEREGLALLSYIRNPDVKDGVVASFIVFDPSLPPDQVIPVWTDEFDAAFVRNGEVVAAWTLQKK